ncbi:MAG: tetratricopeptide repeat protein [Rickettsiales bacterium]|jgi:hypothetical protein
MSDLFSEIKEEIKREKLDKVGRKVGFMAVWGSIAIIAATAGYVGWDSYTQKHAEAKTSQLLLGAELMDSKNYKEAIPIFSALADDYVSPYYLISMLQKARAQELGGDVDGAKKTYEILAKGEFGFSALAKLKSLQKNSTIEVSTSSPLYYTLAEYNAWQLLRMNKNTEAAGVFASLESDEKAPRSLVERAGEVLRVITPNKSLDKSMEKKTANE